MILLKWKIKWARRDEIIKKNRFSKREYINIDIFYWQLLLVTQKEIPADNKYLLPKIKVHFGISEQYPLSRNSNLVLLSFASGYKLIVCWTIFLQKQFRTFYQKLSFKLDVVFCNHGMFCSRVDEQFQFSVSCKAWNAILDQRNQRP